MSSRKDNDAPATLSPDAFAPVPAAQFKPPLDDFDPMEAVAAAKKKKKKKKVKSKSEAPDIGVWGEDQPADANGESSLAVAATSASSADSGAPPFGSSSSAAPFEGHYLDNTTSNPSKIESLPAAPQAEESRPSFDDDMVSYGNGGSSIGDSDDPDAPPSPGTIARNALRAARSSIGPGESTAPTVSAESTFAPDDLRAVLVGVMRNKDALEEEVRTLEGKLESANHQIAELQRANTELRERSDGGEGSAASSGGLAQTALEKENELLKVQLKKYVSENNQLKRASRAILEVC